MKTVFNLKHHQNMKTKQTTFIIEQILIIVGINYLILISEGFLFKAPWQHTFILALAFFNVGTLISLYLTITDKSFSIMKEIFLFNFNLFIYLSFVSLLIYQNSHVRPHSNFTLSFLGLLTLFFAAVFLFETVSSYNKYKTVKPLQK
jgi:predicted neutral ceramidase superfamily lipid hydrolase